MQIVAGRFRHRKLETNPGDTTRPILTRVKISLFDQLQPLLVGARVADVYSGTGTIGLEALSRGAVRVTFFEQDRRAFELLRKNIETLGVDAETLTWRTDVTKCSFRPRKGAEFTPFDVVFFDPPYAHLEKLAPGTMLYRSLQRLARDGITVPRAWLAVRCAQGAEFAMPPVWELSEKLVYSSMEVHLFRKSAQPSVSSSEPTADEFEDSPSDSGDESTDDPNFGEDGIGVNIETDGD